MSKKFKLYAPIKDISKNGLRLYFNDIKSLRIENRTFRTIIK